MSTDQFSAIVKARLAAGDTPAAIEGDFDSALKSAAVDWVLGRDGQWQRDTVCVRCGSCFPRACGGYSVKHPVGKPCTSEKPILRSEYNSRKLWPA